MLVNVNKSVTTAFHKRFRSPCTGS